MKAMKAVLSCVFIFILFSAFGCVEKPPKSTTVDFYQAEVKDDTLDIDIKSLEELSDDQSQNLGENIRIKFINPETTVAINTHKLVNKEMQEKIEDFINNNEIKIARVDINYCSHSAPHIFSAVIFYRFTGD